MSMACLLMGFRIGVLLIVFSSCLSFLTTGCSSIQGNTTHDADTRIYPQDKLPSPIHEIKRVKVFANRKKNETGIYLRQDELVSIMADGEIFRFLTSDKAQPETAAVKPMVWWIGGVNYGTIFSQSYGRTIISPQSGGLNVGIIDDYYKDNKGYYDVIIVQWNTHNFVLIADTLEDLLKKFPDHTGVKAAYQQASNFRDLEIARTQTSHEIEATKEKIGNLKKESNAQAGSSNADQEKHEQELQNRLSELTSKLSQLDELNRQLQQERDKAAQLSRELQEKEKREKELMSRIKSPMMVPPVMIISSPEEGHQNEIGTVRLSGAVEDDRGLKQLKVYLNEMLVEPISVRSLHLSESKAPLRWLFNQTITLHKGDNQIRVVATDIDGLTVERTLTVNYTERRSNVWAVVVGINDYPYLPRLKYAINDANAFYKILIDKDRIPVENISLLLNDQASLKNLRNALGTHLKRVAGTDDMVIIYFAGHGAVERDAISPDGDGLEKYLLAYDTEPSDLFSTAMPMRDIAHIFNRIRSERLVFIVDACYSGASGGRTFSLTGMRTNLADTFLDRVVKGRGKIIITASSANEVSAEKDELEHGVFTYYLLEGLRGKADSDRDGIITVDEVYNYVFEQVPQATGQEQHPVKKGTVEGQLVLSIIE